MSESKDPKIVTRMGALFLLFVFPLAVVATETRSPADQCCAPSGKETIEKAKVSDDGVDASMNGSREKERSSTDEATMKAVDLKIGDTGSFDHQGTTYTWKVMNDGKKWLTINLNVEVDDSWSYMGDPESSETYGRLYTWDAAKAACSALGDNWRLPSDEDWKRLAIAYGGYHDWQTGTVVGNPGEAYEALTEEGESGFSAILAGWRDPAGNFDYLGENGIFWSSSLREDNDARGFGFYRSKRMMARGNGARSFGHSVRCLQDL